jgi:hypothetical protein
MHDLISKVMISRSDDHPITSRTAAAMTINMLFSQSCAATAEAAYLGIELIAGGTASDWTTRVQIAADRSTRAVYG